MPVRRVPDLAVLSPKPAVTTRAPSGLKDADQTLEVCPLSVRSRYTPVRASQTCGAWSGPAVTIRDPSGLNDAEITPLVCPLSVREPAPVRASRIYRRLVRTPGDDPRPVGAERRYAADAGGVPRPNAAGVALSVTTRAPVLASQTFDVSHP